MPRPPRPLLLLENPYAAHHPAPALTLRVDPRTGLLPGHFEELAAWAGAL